MESRKGYTLIELMVVVLIIGLLAAIAIPILRNRIDSAKWLEGKAGAGSIRTACRAFMSEKGPDWGGNWANVDLPMLGFKDADLDSKYFTDESYSISVTAYDTYVITVDASDSTSPDKPTVPDQVTLNQNGVWTADGVVQ